MLGDKKVVKGELLEEVKFTRCANCYFYNKNKSECSIYCSYNTMLKKVDKPKTLQEMYLEEQDKCGIEVGDTVRVIGRVKNCAMGWILNWVPQMDGTIDKEYIVDCITANKGISLGYQAYYPFFCLELIKKAEKKPEKKVEPKNNSFGEVLESFINIMRRIEE
jgi:hypothetical protein